MHTVLVKTSRSALNKSDQIDILALFPMLGENIVFPYTLVHGLYFTLALGYNVVKAFKP